ncbi:hypothetical protein Bca4012_061610 [Brassica carinata]
MQGEVQLQPMDAQKPNHPAFLLGGSAPSPLCRICLERDRSDIFGDGLISTCMCRGTRQFVHRWCFDHWRSRKEGFAFSHCSTCKAQFHFRDDLGDRINYWRRKFALMPNRELLLWLLAVQPVIAVFTGFAYMMDTNQDFRNSIKHGPLYHDRILAKYAIPFYYIFGES